MRRPGDAPSTTSLSLGGVAVTVVRKRVKHVNLRVYPPAGSVVVSAPARMADSEIRAVVAGRLAWIERQRARYRACAPARVLEYVDGEEHRLFGTPYRLRLVYGSGRTGLSDRAGDVIDLRTSPSADRAARQRALETWQRAVLAAEIDRLVSRWAPVMHVVAPVTGIRRMTSRWGSCNHRAGRIWLNFHLVSRPPSCLEYVVVHELAHLLVPNHSAAFWAVVQRHLPGWRVAKQELSRWPLWAGGRVGS